MLGRKAWLFADTVGGARASANLYSLVETAKSLRLFSLVPIFPLDGLRRCNRLQ